MSTADSRDQPGSSVEVLARRLIGGEGENHHANYDAPMELQLQLRFRRGVSDPHIVFSLTTETGFHVCSYTSPAIGTGRIFAPGELALVRIPFRARLGGGNYALAAEVQGHNGELLGGSDGLMLFVSGRPGSLGAIDLRARIEVDDADRTDLRSTLLEV